MFDELLTPSPSVDPTAPEVIAPITKVVAPKPAESTGSHSSTIVDQYAPSPSKSQTTTKTQPHVIPNDVKEYNHDIEVTHMGNDLFFEVVATACYTQNRSIVCLHHGKTPYKLLHGKLPNLSFLYVFGAPCYPTNETPEVIAPITKVVAPKPAESTGSHSSTIVDQYAPSPSKSQTTTKTQPHVIPNDVKEYNHDIEVTHMGNDLFFGMLILEVASDQSLSTDSIHTIVHPDHQIS
nr:retrovirus-related Pol polyprotein from transposon TNT 1-94 [Tanacetum cinerariifolium]